MSEDNARPAKRPLRHLPSIRPLSWSSTISSVAVRTPDFCPGDLRLAPNCAPVTTHERMGRPKRCPKTKSKKAANAIKTGMGFVSCLANRGRLRWNVRGLWPLHRWIGFKLQQMSAIWGLTPRLQWLRASKPSRRSHQMTEAESPKMPPVKGGYRAGNEDRDLQRKQRQQEAYQSHGLAGH